MTDLLAATVAVEHHRLDGLEGTREVVALAGRQLAEGRAPVLFVEIAVVAGLSSLDEIAGVEKKRWNTSLDDAVAAHL